MYTVAWLIIGNFEALLSPVKFVHKYPTTVRCRESHVEHFGPNSLFVHLLEVI